MKTIRELLKNEIKHSTFKAVIKEAEKDSKIKKFKTIVLGHLHKKGIFENNGRKYIFMPSFLDDQKPLILSRKFYKYYIISDTHIGSSLWTRKHTKKFKEILETINESKTKKLILLGDIIELWTQNPKRVIKKYSDIINNIEEMGNKVIWIRGNHDWDIRNYVKIDVLDYYTVKDIYFAHGHQYDPVMNASWYRKLWLWVWLRWGDNFWWINNKLKWW